MGYLPIFVDAGGRPCVVIGGGEIAERKTRSLVDASAEVTVVSPSLTAGLAAMARRNTIRHRARTYRPGDLEGAFLAFEASGKVETERAAAAEARARGVLINVADVPDLCSFIAPAVIKRGGLQIAVSTGGASPAFARKIREELEDRFGLEYELMIDLLAAARQWLQAREHDLGARTRLLTALVRSDLRECLHRADLAAAEATVHRLLGASFAELGFDPALPSAALDRPSSATNRRAGKSR
ncbi:MAG: bifunctional precorrin-2 dehydrogenase/sirohydrochlorin ferrochelatase [Candidatus Binataceae bacterium]|jgi:precorrin-2 dehydrogenase/sirohydrochlorin ferrochelatase